MLEGQNTAENELFEHNMDQYIDLSVALVGFAPITPEQRIGIKQYFSFARTMMKPLLAARRLENENG